MLRLYPAMQLLIRVLPTILIQMPRTKWWEQNLPAGVAICFSLSSEEILISCMIFLYASSVINFLLDFHLSYFGIAISFFCGVVSSDFFYFINYGE